MNETRERIDYIDVAKGILIISDISQILNMSPRCS